MEQDEKRKLADELKNAADDVLNLDDMEKVAGGLLDLKCKKQEYCHIDE